MAKKKNVFSAVGAMKNIKNRKKKQAATIDKMFETPGEARRRKLVEEAGGSYNK